MPSTPPRAPHPTQTALQGKQGAAGADDRVAPEWSLLRSAAPTWSSQVVLGRRASYLGSAAQARRTGVPPSASIHTVREKGHRSAAFQPMNQWGTSSRTGRGQVQLQTPPLPPQHHNSPISFAISSHGLPAYPNQPTDNTANDHTHLAPLPLAPPPLRRLAPIALPPLSPLTPVQIHPVLAYHPSPTGPDAAVHWNMALPPSSARLAFALGGLPASRWSREVAVAPRTLPSLTVRMAGVARAVVVFPGEMGGPIRVGDVLSAVYRALWLAALECIGGVGAAAGAAGAVVGCGCAGGGGVVDDAVAADAIRRYFRGDIWWGGLYESPEERDVWVLELHGARA